MKPAHRQAIEPGGNLVGSKRHGHRHHHIGFWRASQRPARLSPRPGNPGRGVGGEGTPTLSPECGGRGGTSSVLTARGLIARVPQLFGRLWRALGKDCAGCRCSDTSFRERRKIRWARCHGWPGSACSWLARCFRDANVAAAVSDRQPIRFLRHRCRKHPRRARRAIPPGIRSHAVRAVLTRRTSRPPGPFSPHRGSGRWARRRLSLQRTLLVLRRRRPARRTPA